VEAPPAPPPLVRTFMVFFDFDKSTLTPEARDVISEAVKTAKQLGPVHIMVTGHTDTVGSLRYNQGLSERRARSVKNEMIRLGMNGGDIETIGRSFKDPLVPTGPGVREPQNRRAVIDLGNPPVASAE
jgi:outer membrane protein OmpA-like peptidoglycan-associated protein